MVERKEACSRLSEREKCSVGENRIEDFFFFVFFFWMGGKGRGERLFEGKAGYFLGIFWLRLGRWKKLEKRNLAISRENGKVG